MADININNKVAITTFGGSYVSGGQARLFAETVPAVGETYYWDDTGQTREGWTIAVPSGMIVTRIVIYGSQSYPFRAITVEKDGVELAPRGYASTSAPYTFTGGITGTFQIARYPGGDQAMTRIHIFGVASKVLLKSNNAFYSTDSANYNTTTKQYTPLNVTADQITPDFIETNGVLSATLLENVTIGTETFKPVDKFAKFQIITKGSNPVTLTGTKRRQCLLRSKAAYSFKGMANIDNFTTVQTLAGSGSIKMAIQVEGETQWKTTADNGVTWIPLNITIPASNYKDLTPTDLIAWNGAISAILATGIPITSVSSINFNAFAGKKIFVAFVLNITNAVDKAILTSLSTQYDGTPYLRLMKDSELNVDLIDDVTIQVTPLIANDLIKVNISNGGTRGLS